MSIAPIALFVYNRPFQTQLTVDALKTNELAKESTLFIFSDAPKDTSTKENVSRVREYTRTVDGFKSVALMERREHYGLARSIISGATEIVNKFGKVIVLEDDLVTSPFFLRYMNDALDQYEHEEKVISIHGYIYPVQERLPATFFLRGADCWGWATWKRGWDLFEENGQKLLNELRQKKLTEQFDLNGAYRYTRMLRLQSEGKNDSWAVRWYASAFLHERLTLYPGVSLVQHVGNDGAGTHFGVSDVFSVKLATEPVNVQPIAVAENPEARRIVQAFFRSVKTPIITGIINRGRKHFARACQMSRNQLNRRQ